MRTLERNKTALYYALFVGKRDGVDEDGNRTGETVLEFTDPVLAEMNVSPSRGTSDLDQFGVSLNYQRTAITGDMSCPITEATRIWYGVNPADSKHNFVVVAVAKSINSISYALREVDVS